MPRIARGIADNFIYHVINRGNDKREIFHKDRDFEAFVHLMYEAKERFDVRILAYCLMPNHFHMVLLPERGEYLSKWMQWVMTCHVRRYHRHYGSGGHIWQGRYKSFVVEGNEHLLMVLRYTEGNPVRAKLVSSAKEWKWSSHKEALSNRSLTSEAPIELPTEWDKYVDEPLTETDMEKLRHSVNRQTPYGNSKWQSKVCQQYGLEATMRRRGRPKKEENRQEK